jgi:general secretion pathway protein A
MYTHYFNLRQEPFSIAPDPRYLFMSERHREALAHLLYGIKSGGGFVLLTGEIGAGKTTVCRCFIEQVPAECALAYIFNPKLTALELLQSVCDEFHIALPPQVAGGASVKPYVDAINAYLLASHAQGRNNVLVIDEAQNLSAEVLEQLRLLTNLETSERKLLQIILIGQPELRTMLARADLEQLAQRVIARYHLGPLSASETGSYIAHRMTVAGASSTPFPRRLLGKVHQMTRGVPRRINLLCDRALLGAYVENERDVTALILARAAAEVFADDAARAARWPRRALFGAAALMATLAVSAAAWQLMPKAPPPARPAAVAAKPLVPLKPAPLLPLLHAQQDDALRALVALWGAPVDDGDPCQLAVRQGVRCHQGKGGLFALRLLDRPAVLTLHDGATLGYALLLALDHDNATLARDGKRQVLPVADLAARFDGEFTTLWRAPQSFRDELHAGEHGADVDWLAAQLAQLQGLAAPAAGEPLGKASLAQLRAFQQQQNLKADGVAGPRTFMRLSQLAGVAEPRLLATSGAGK